MNEIQEGFEGVIKDAADRGVALSEARTAKIVYKSLQNAAPAMLHRRRIDAEAFAKRNSRRWRKPFDLIETIWVCCEEVGSAYNHATRPSAIKEHDYTFEALTYLHAKSLLVGSEVICLLKGGFADGALARWRTQFELNAVASLLSKEGSDLSIRYLAHSRVQSWLEEQRSGEPEHEGTHSIREAAEHALSTFGEELKRRNGWACSITGQRNPTFDRIATIAGQGEELELYRYASLHNHSNHRNFDDLIGMSEAQEQILLVGSSNSGMVMPLVMTAITLVETTAFLLLSKPNLDRLVLVTTLWRMAGKMNKMASGVEARTLAAARKREAHRSAITDNKAA
jgi:hypothetical protein